MFKKRSKQTEDIAVNPGTHSAGTTSTDFQSWIKEFSAVDIRRLELRTKRKIDSDFVGRFQSSFRGTGLVFHELREYQPGDDVRTIHWKASARSQRTYVKSFVEDRSLNVVLLCDVTASMGSTAYLREPAANTNPSSANSQNHQPDAISKFEQVLNRSLDLSALIALTAYRCDDAIGVGTFSNKLLDFIPPKRSRNQLHRILSTLATPRKLEQGSLPNKTDIAVAIDQILPVIKRRSVFFLISDFFSPPFENELKRLARRHDVILANIEPAVSIAPPQAGMILVRGAEDGQQRIIDCSSQKVRLALQRSAEKRSQELAQLASRCGCDILAVREDPVSALSKLMRLRARRLR